ncbi:hypothetical protein ACFE04_024560 [Oxalis oulophora]
MERVFGHAYSRELGDNAVKLISKMELLEMLAIAKVESGIVTILCGALRKFTVSMGMSNPPERSRVRIEVPKQKGEFECGYYVMMYNYYIISNVMTNLRNPLHEDKKTSYIVDDFLLIKDLVASWAICEMKNR